MSKKEENIIILDLTREEYIPTIPAHHDSPSAKIFEFWTEKNERINDLERIKHETKEIMIKSSNGLYPLELAQNMKTNLLEYFKIKNKEEFKRISCHTLAYYIVHGSKEKQTKYTMKKTEDFQIGDTILMGHFKKILWKTFTLYYEHSAICIAKTETEQMYISKLGDKGDVVVTTLDELKKIYWATTSCAKIIWKN